MLKSPCFVCWLAHNVLLVESPFMLVKPQFNLLLFKSPCLLVNTQVVARYCKSQFLLLNTQFVARICCSLNRHFCWPKKQFVARQLTKYKKNCGHPRGSEDLGERRGRDPPRKSLAGRPAARDVPGAMDSSNSCGWNNAINHPPVITILSGYVYHSQSWVLYDIVLPTLLFFGCKWRLI